MIHGLLWGKAYEAGDSYRGVWGLYGGYDYLAPASGFLPSLQHLRLPRHDLPVVAFPRGGAAGLSPGRHRLRRGRLHPGSGERDYHYGMTPQGLLTLRLLIGDTAMLDLTGHEFYVSSKGATESGTENIAG